MRQSLGSGSRYEEAKSHFEGPYGDCRQELVFIGVEPMDEAVIRKALDDCLIQSKKELADFEKAGGVVRRRRGAKGDVSSGVVAEGPQRPPLS